MTEEQIWILARAIAEYATNQGKSFIYKGRDGFWYARAAHEPRDSRYDSKLMRRVKTDQTGVHKAHCCVAHGCKYGEESCPVGTGWTLQRYPCEACEYDDNEGML